MAKMDSGPLKFSCALKSYIECQEKQLFQNRKFLIPLVNRILQREATFQ